LFSLNCLLCLSRASTFSVYSVLVYSALVHRILVYTSKSSASLLSLDCRRKVSFCRVPRPSTFSVYSVLVYSVLFYSIWVYTNESNASVFLYNCRQRVSYFRVPRASTFSVYSILVYSDLVYSSVSNRLESKRYSFFVCVCWGGEGGGGKLCIRLSNFLYHVPSHFLFRYHPVILKGIYPFHIVSCARSLSLSLSPSLSLSLILAGIYYSSIPVHPLSFSGGKATFFWNPLSLSFNCRWRASWKREGAKIKLEEDEVEIRRSIRCWWELGFRTEILGLRV